MRRWMVAVIFVALLSAGWFYASPWMAMASLRDAAREGDLAALSAQVDFPALRQSVKHELLEQTKRASTAPGVDLPAAFDDELVRGAITPEGMAGLIASGNLIPQRSVHAPDEIYWHVKRQGFSAFRAVPETATGEARPSLLFRREGLSWKLVGLDIPARDIEDD